MQPLSSKRYQSDQYIYIKNCYQTILLKKTHF